MSNPIMTQDDQVFFERQLEYVKTQVFNVKYPGFKFRQLFPISYETPVGTSNVLYTAYDHVGKTEWIAGNGQNLPRVDTSGEEQSIPVKHFGTSFEYNIFEIQKAQKAGVNLDQLRVNAAAKVCEYNFNDVAWNGAASVGLKGMLSAAWGIPTGNVPNGAAGTPGWTTKTAPEILLDINTILSEISTNSLGVEAGNTLTIPLAQWNFIATMMVDSTSDMTLLQYVVRNSPFLKSVNDIVADDNLKGAGAAGVDVMIAYPKSPDILQFEIIEDTKFHPPFQVSSLAWEVAATGTTAGLNIYYPNACNRKEKI